MAFQKMDRFLDDIVSYMKNPFVKEEVKMELRDHMLDKIDYYMEIGHQVEVAEDLMEVDFIGLLA